MTEKRRHARRNDARPSGAAASARAARFDLRDLAAEVLEGVGARPLRLFVSLLGTVVGIGALVLTVGLGQTAGGQLDAHFDRVAAEHAEITPQKKQGADGEERAAAALPDDSVDRVRRLAGVLAAATLTALPTEGLRVSAVPVHDPSEPETTPPPVYASSGELVEAVGADLIAGRAFDVGHDARGDRVAILGSEAAKALGIRRLEPQPSVFLGDRSYTIIGILGKSATQAHLAGAVVIPTGAARRDFPSVPPDLVALHLESAAGELVSRQAPIALDPNEPDVFTVAAPSRPTALQNEVGDDLDLVFLAIGLITLLAGGLGIANVTTLSVSERTGEIGLRRALGATRRQIGAQFVVESVVVGALGGVIGVALAVLAIVAVSALRGWTPVLDLPLAFGCAGLGAAVGLTAGAYPAAKAARTEPADALRSS
jgi:putative ABC transport system permease protein